jgi:outer membrane protein assembly factor BamD
MIKIAILIVFVTIFSACSSKMAKKDEAFNKSDNYWYQEIIKDVKINSLDKADEAYTSLSSEHVASPLLKEAMMILAKAHMNEEEYIMANYYIDEYIKRYASSKNIDYLKFLKIKSNFKSFKRINRDQKLLLDTINKANAFVKEFPQSKFKPDVETILTRLYLTNQMLNQNIVALYKKTGKLKAAKIYEEKINNSWLRNVKIQEAKKGFLSIF